MNLIFLSAMQSTTINRVIKSSKLIFLNNYSKRQNKTQNSIKQYKIFCFVGHDIVL